MLDNSTTPVLTAFLLGLLTAISPCPLATNIAAIGYISKDIVDRRSAFRKGLLYALGRLAAYTILGIVLIGVIRRGASMFGIQNFIGTLGEQLLGPLLIIIGTLMLFSSKLNLPQFGFKGNGEKIAKKNGWGAFLLGCLFAMAFCPSSGMFYFGMLIVGNCQHGLPYASRLCRGHGIARTHRGMDSGIQRKRDWQVLRHGEEHGTMDKLRRSHNLPACRLLLFIHYIHLIRHEYFSKISYCMGSPVHRNRYCRRTFSARHTSNAESV